MKTLICALALLLGGCALFGDDPPDRTCDNDTDCFEAQGETCNEETKVCEVAGAGADAGAALTSEPEAP